MRNEMEERGRARPRRSLRSARDDDGVGLIEILVAFTVFMVCFLPLLIFLPSGSRIIVNSSNQRFATSIADQTLQSAQNSTFPGTWNVDQTTARTTWALLTPTLMTTTQVVQGGVTFQVYTVGGWCVLDPSTGLWNGTLSSNPPGQPSYHVVVKVGWGRGISASSTTNVVVDSTELSSTAGAPTTDPVGSCPLGLA
jgi:hypothetical protein